jgi:hypothetical protein
MKNRKLGFLDRRGACQECAKTKSRLGKNQSVLALMLDALLALPTVLLPMFATPMIDQ